LRDNLQDQLQGNHRDHLQRDLQGSLRHQLRDNPEYEFVRLCRWCTGRVSSKTYSRTWSSSPAGGVELAASKPLLRCILALYIALRRGNESLMVIALALGLLEAVAFIVARPAFEMLYLSNQYAAAITDVQRDLFLAVGEAIWATFHGTAFHLSINLFSVYFLIVPLVMLRSSIFSKLTAYVGILAAWWRRMFGG
jgi:hypothetical protein